jgi:acyl-coenzyme A synthetase/AMP-(fatty) acid ligase/acyl carrier protein
MSTALLALLNGAALCPFNLREQGVEGLAEFLLRERITIYVSAPTVFRHFARTLTAAEAFPDLRIVRLGGEAVRVKDVLLYQRWFGRQAILVNSFSSTETGNVTQYHIHGDTDISSNRVPVGFTVEDMRVSLLDDDGQEVGPDRIGEIAVQSRCLSLGYWREPELTQAVFRSAADGGERIYRTGDLGRLRSDGCLEHLGRKDAQIKLRGHRIELEEVELLLSRHPAVQAAVVEAREDRLEDSCLVAFVVPRQPNKIETAELRSYLRNNLPEHMVPSAFILLQSLPMLPSGKVDHQALPGDHRPAADGGPDRHQPGNPLEQRLAAIWCEVLDLKEVGTQDNFFNLGGHSLRAAQVISRLRAAIGVEVPLRLLFEKPTIAELAETVNRYLISGRAAPQAALPSITT